MTTPISRQNLLPSLLDRLLEPDGPWTIESVKKALQRDLEWLLNTRRGISTPAFRMNHLSKSSVTYGLPDLTSFRPGVFGGEEELRLAVQDAIRRFEPRLSQVRVTLLVQPDFDRMVRFRIDAILRVEPDPEPVSFDSRLRLVDQTFEVREEAP